MTAWAPDGTNVNSEDHSVVDSGTLEPFVMPCTLWELVQSHVWEWLARCCACIDAEVTPGSARGLQPHPCAHGCFCKRTCNEPAGGTAAAGRGSITRVPRWDGSCSRRPRLAAGQDGRTSACAFDWPQDAVSYRWAGSLPAGPSTPCVWLLRGCADNAWKRRARRRSSWPRGGRTPWQGALMRCAKGQPNARLPA